MSATVFSQPKSQWIALLKNRSWGDLCQIDFPHVMAYGSNERLRIFLDTLFAHKKDFNDHILSLASAVGESTFKNSKWTPGKAEQMLIVLQQLNLKFRSKYGGVPLMPLIEAVVRHNRLQSQPSIALDAPLWEWAVLEESDLLANLMERVPENQHESLENNLFTKAGLAISLHSNRLFFSTTAVQIMPTYCDKVVERVCDNLRWDLNLNLSVAQRLKRTISNFIDRKMGGPAWSPEDIHRIHMNEIATFDQFVAVHQDVFTPQHWTMVLHLFKRIQKKYHTPQATVLNARALKKTLQSVVSEPLSCTPAKRKM